MCFLLNESTINAPSFFQIVFRIKGIQYRYGFEVDAERVVSEWLFYVPRTKETLLFKRTPQDGIEVSEKYQEGKGLERLTRANALFLSVVAQFDGSTAKEILRWFSAFRIMSEPNDFYPLSSIIQLFDNEDYTASVKEFIKDLDLDVRDILTETREVDFSEPTRYPGYAASNAILRRAETTPKTKIKEMRTVHRQFDSEGNVSGIVLFDVRRQESDGTRKLIAYSGSFVQALKTGRILFIDELDARLHPLITCAIIRLFNSRKTNPFQRATGFSPRTTPIC